MFKKYLIIILTIIGLNSYALAGDDGELLLKKNNPSEVLTLSTWCLSQCSSIACFKRSSFLESSPSASLNCVDNADRSALIFM